MVQAAFRVVAVIFVVCLALIVIPHNAVSLNSGGNPPSPPCGFDGKAGGGIVRLSWYTPIDNGGASITEYRIYRATCGANLGFNHVIPVSSSKTEYIDNTVENGGSYVYYMTAKNEFGESDMSSMFYAEDVGFGISATEFLGCIVGFGFIGLLIFLFLPRRK
ncbi:MAG: fibronectin type III domain-containing protein [Candidatus Thermoplasmatota archaeon]|nr:fibronectin type III domain-containing protein [Candidatus Thermoplasmatota archaeon]